MACYQRHERTRDALNLVELNKVLRAVGFAKYSRAGGTVKGLPAPPKPPKVPKMEDPRSRSQQRGQPEPGSTKAILQSKIFNTNSSTDSAEVTASSTMPPQPPTLHLHADSIKRALQQHRKDHTAAPPKMYRALAEDEGEDAKEKKQQQQQRRHPVRSGDESSFHVVSSFETHVHSLAAHRCYRILTYEDTEQGRIVFDILNGTEYYCRSGPQKRRITPNVPVFNSVKDAMSEKFPPGDGRLSMPRILVRFDAWGRCRKRLGGGDSAVYEYVKFLGIIRFLDAPASISAKQCDHPVAPHMYPRADKPLKQRKSVDKRIKIDLGFDIAPWHKGVSLRVS